MELSSSEQDYAMIVGKKYEIATTTSLHLFTLRCHYIDLPSVQNIVHLVNLQELRLMSVDLTNFPNNFIFALFQGAAITAHRFYYHHLIRVT